MTYLKSGYTTQIHKRKHSSNTTKKNVIIHIWYLPIWWQHAKLTTLAVKFNLTHAGLWFYARHIQPSHWGHRGSGKTARAGLSRCLARRVYSPGRSRRDAAAGPVGVLAEVGDRPRTAGPALEDSLDTVLAHSGKDLNNHPELTSKWRTLEGVGQQIKLGTNVYTFILIHGYFPCTLFFFIGRLEVENREWRHNQSDAGEKCKLIISSGNGGIAQVGRNSEATVQKVITKRS